MSYFEDQQEAWYNNNCQGDIESIDPYVQESFNIEDDEDYEPVDFGDIPF